jgi:hypothetical protein
VTPDTIRERDAKLNGATPEIDGDGECERPRGLDAREDGGEERRETRRLRVGGEDGEVGLC